MGQNLICNRTCFVSTSCAASDSIHVADADVGSNESRPIFPKIRIKMGSGGPVVVRSNCEAGQKVRVVEGTRDTVKSCQPNVVSSSKGGLPLGVHVLLQDSDDDFQ